MANPFDQFDAPAANPFDQFDTAAPAPMPTPTPAAPTGGGAVGGLIDTLLTAGRIGLKQAQRMERTTANIPASAINLGQGAYNLAENIYDPLTGKSAVGQTLSGAASGDINSLAKIIGVPIEIANSMVQRYGSPDAVVKTMTEDPVGFAADLAMFSPATRAAGAVATAPMKAAEKVTSAIVRPEPTLAPTLRAEAKASKQAGFAGSKEAAEAQYNPQAYQDFLTNAKTELEKAQYRSDLPSQFKNVTETLNTLEKRAAEPLPADITKVKSAEKYQAKPISLGDVEGLRKEIGTLYKKGSADEKRLATVLINEFDKFWENPANALPGNEALVSQGASNLRTGIDRSHELFQDRVISSIVKRADAAPDFTKSLRKQFTKIADDEKKIGRFTPDQQSIIREIAEGKTSSPWVEQLASLAPGLRGNRLPLIAETALAYTVSPYVAGGVALAGKGAQMASERAARQAVNRLAKETFKPKNAMAR